MIVMGGVGILEVTQPTSQHILNLHKKQSLERELRHQQPKPKPSQHPYIEQSFKEISL